MQEKFKQQEASVPATFHFPGKHGEKIPMATGKLVCGATSPCYYMFTTPPVTTVVRDSQRRRKKSEKQSGLEMISVWALDEGKVATRLGTREKMPLSLLSLVATMESDILFSSGLSLASSKT